MQMKHAAKHIFAESRQASSSEHINLKYEPFPEEKQGPVSNDQSDHKIYDFVVRLGMDVSGIVKAVQRLNFELMVRT